MNIRSSMFRRLLAVATALLYALPAMAQVMVDSEPLQEDMFADESVSAPDSLSALYFWIFMVFAVFSFALFWRNRHVIASLFSNSKTVASRNAHDGVVFLDERDTPATQNAGIDDTDMPKRQDTHVSNDLSYDSQVEREDGVNIYDVHASSADEDDSYIKPELKIVMEDSGPRLVFK